MEDKGRRSAEADLIEATSRAIDPVAWGWIDRTEVSDPTHIALADVKRNRLDAGRRAVEAVDAFRAGKASQ